MYDSHSRHDLPDQGESRRLARLLGLIQLLDNGLQRNAGELAEILSVSRRTVFRDLKEVQRSGVPVEYNEQTKKYRIVRQLKIPSTPKMSDVLCVAAVLLAARQSPEMRRAVAFLELELSRQLGDSHELQAFESAFEWLKDERQPATQPVPWEHIHVLFQGFVQRNKVRITFTNAGTENTLFSPYRFVLGDEGWEIAGWSSLHRSRIRVKAELLTGAVMTENSFVLPSD